MIVILILGLVAGLVALVAALVLAHRSDERDRKDGWWYG